MKSLSLPVITLVFGFLIDFTRPQSHDDHRDFCPKEITSQTMQKLKLPTHIPVLEVCQNISKISPDGFQRFIDLQELVLNGNVQITFPSDGSAFISHDKLAHLSCAHCGISEIFKGSLKSMPSLETINLTSNAIQRISSEAFKGNPKLVYIGLSKNDLYQIPADMIEGINLLKSLNLSSNNKLAPIGNDSFLISTSLEELNCDDCGFTIISFSTFARMINLKTLYLRRNNIVSIDQQAFGLHKSLSILMLQNNQLTTVDFSLLDKPMKLCLEENRIKLDCNESIPLNLGRFQCSNASQAGIECNVKTTTERAILQPTTISQDVAFKLANDVSNSVITTVAPQMTSSTTVLSTILLGDKVIGISDAYITGYLSIICIAQVSIIAALIGVYLKMVKNDADPAIDCYAESIVNPTALNRTIR